MKRLSIIVLFSVLLAACSGGETTESAALTPSAQAQAAVAGQPEATRAELVAVATVAQVAQFTAEPDAVDGESALPQTYNGEQIVAEVNGEPITLAQFQRAVDRHQVSDIVSYDAVASAELERLIEQALIRQAAGQMGIRVSEADIDAEVAAMREIMPDDIAWQTWLMNNRFINENEFRQATFDALVTQRVQEQVIALSGSTVQQVRARHILTETQSEAQAAYERIQAGEDFADVAREASIDATTADVGGDLGVDGGFIVPADLIVPEIAVLALSQATGAISQPTPSILGWHIVQTLEVGERPATLEELAMESAVIFETWLQEQENAADIQRYIE